MGTQSRLPTPTPCIYLPPTLTYIASNIAAVLHQFKAQHFDDPVKQFDAKLTTKIP